MYLDTLRYIYRTGRMSKMSARMASLFKIRPISIFNEKGQAEMVDKVRSREDGVKRIISLIQEKMPDEKLTFMISHGDAPEMAANLAEQFKQNFKCQDIIISDYSPVMGYGGGPGAMCIGVHLT